MKKRIFAAALAAAMLCAVLSGCSGSSSSSAAASSASESAAPQANEITVGIAQDLDESLDPHLAVAAGTKEVMFNVFEGLMKPTSDGDLTPAIAESYTLSDDRGRCGLFHSAVRRCHRRRASGSRLQGH